MAIDLGGDGPTSNDAGDADAGPNRLQNFPEITEVRAEPLSTTVRYRLSGEPSRTYALTFFTWPAPNSTGRGQGMQQIHNVNVTTDAAGEAVGSFTAGRITPGSYLTAVATRLEAAADRTLLSSTSEFSPAVRAARSRLVYRAERPAVRTAAPTVLVAVRESDVEAPRDLLV